jgi:uncharacterized protein YhfF
MNLSTEKMWQDYLSKNNITDTTLIYDSWYFCDNERDAIDLVNLVLIQKKTATCSLLETYTLEVIKMPHINQYSVITDFYGEAKCIVKTINIDIVAYDKVTAAFAFKEGEGDQSLKYWQDVHWKYFENYLKPFNKTMTEDALLVCEEFELIHH